MTWLWGPEGLVFLGPVELKQSDHSLYATTSKALHRRQTHAQSSHEKGLFICPGV